MDGKHLQLQPREISLASAGSESTMRQRITSSSFSATLKWKRWDFPSSQCPSALSKLTSRSESAHKSLQHRRRCLRTDQEYLAIEQYLAQYRADLVVLWQTPANDIWNNVFNTHMASRNPKPTFWLDEARHLQGPSERLGEPLPRPGSSPSRSSNAR